MSEEHTEDCMKGAQDEEDIFRKHIFGEPFVERLHIGDVVKCEARGSDNFYGILLYDGEDYYSILRKGPYFINERVYKKKDITLTKTGEHLDIDKMFDRMEQEV